MAAFTVVVTAPAVAAALVVRAEVGGRDQARERQERAVPETDQDSRAVVAAAGPEVGARGQVRERQERVVRETDRDSVATDQADRE